MPRPDRSEERRRELLPVVAACFVDRITIDREYGVIDNDALLRVLRQDVDHRADLRRQPRWTALLIF